MSDFVSSANSEGVPFWADDRPMIVVEFTLPDGEVLSRSWSVAECVKAKPDVDEALSWVTNPRKAWDHPQDPITFRANVKPDSEQEVRAWMAR